MRPEIPMGRKRSPWVFLLTGWLAMVAAVFLIGFGWPSIFPSGEKLAEFYHSNIGYPLVVLTALLIATPVALVGGLIGSRLPREGGRFDQHVAAALVAIMLSLPLSCLVLWYLTP
jgi:hypothetical protein